MRIGICDDMADARQEIQSMLWASNPHLTVLKYTSGEDLLDQLSHGDTLDLLFLDIYMGGMDGIETARQIRQSNKTLPIVYLTTSADFALPAFDVGANGYLLKPVTANQLLEQVSKHHIEPPTPPYWVIASPNGDISIPIDQLLYIEQRGNYAEIHMTDQSILTFRITFSLLESQMEPWPQLITCGRSYLLNLTHVRKLHIREVVLADGTSLPIPRRVYSVLREAFLRFYQGGYS